MATNNRNNNRYHGNPELNKTVHWRRVKNIAQSIFTTNRYDSSYYDFNNICCYTCLGCHLQGDNVNYANGKQNSCWVKDNSYTVFEIPAKQNNGEPYEGWFYVLAQNTSFDYWVASTMKYTVNKNMTISKNYLVADVDYEVLGQYSASPVYENSAEMTVREMTKGSKCVFDNTTPTFKDFDHVSSRLKAYGTSANKIVAKLTGKTYSQNHTVGGAQVKKYRNNRSGKSSQDRGTRS